jgi:hypothetical protein
MLRALVKMLARRSPDRRVDPAGRQEAGSTPGGEMPGGDTTGGELLGWCVVANVAEQTVQGEDHEVRRGVKHFAPGAKVWVLPPQWGDGGEQVCVVGRHRGRGRHGLIRMVMPRRHLTNFRVRGVYSPAVHMQLTRPWQRGKFDHPVNQWGSRADAERAMRWWNEADDAAKAKGA